jgi:hypothetical protein
MVWGAQRQTGIFFVSFVFVEDSGAFILGVCFLQEQWQRSGKTPAARVIRVAPKISTAPKPSPSASATTAKPPTLPAALAPAMITTTPIVTDIPSVEPSRKKKSLFAQQRTSQAPEQSSFILSC